MAKKAKNLKQHRESKFSTSLTPEVEFAEDSRIFKKIRHMQNKLKNWLQR
jgi:hypothetical protein